MPTRIRLSRRERQEGHCTFCRDTLEPKDVLVSCLSCSVRLHQSCREELTRCPTIGCVGTWSDRIRVGPTRYTSPLSAGEANLGLGNQILTKGCLAVVGAGILAALVAVGGALQADRRALSAARTGEAKYKHLDSLIEYYVEGTKSERNVAAKGITQVGSRGTKELLEGLSVIAAGSHRSGAITLLAQVALKSSQGTHVVASHLNDRDPRIVRLAAAVLRFADRGRVPSSAVARLRSLAKAQDQVYVEALLHLDTSHDSIRAVGRKMRSSNREEARRAAKALTGLGRRAAPAYPDVEQVLLYGPHHWVACSVAGAIGPPEEQRTYPLLEKLAKRTKDPIVRRCALAAMCGIGGRGVRHVVGVLAARQEREGLLADLLSDPATPPLDLARALGLQRGLGNLKVRSQLLLLKALAPLGGMSAPARPFLAGCLKSPSADVRRESARLLKEIRGAVPKEAERATSLNIRAGLSAVKRLAALKGAPAEAALLHAIRRAPYDQVRRAAIAALRGRRLVNKPEVLKALASAAKHHNRAVRKDAESLRLDLIQRR